MYFADSVSNNMKWSDLHIDDLDNHQYGYLRRNLHDYHFRNPDTEGYKTLDYHKYTRWFFYMLTTPT